MKFLWLAITLFLTGTAYGHEYQRAKYDVDCTWIATKQDLVSSEITLNPIFKYHASTDIVDGRFLKVKSDDQISNAGTSAVAVQFDYSAPSGTTARPIEFLYAFANPMIEGFSSFVTKLHLTLGNNSIDNDFRSFLPILTDGPVGKYTHDVQTLLAAFGEQPANLEQAVVQSEMSSVVRLTIDQSSVLEQTIQVHFPESINHGLSYHVRFSCGTSLSTVH